MICLYAAVPRWPRRSAPATFTTASTPSSAGSSTCAVAAFQKTSSVDSGGRRTRRTTRWPLDVREPQSAVPIIPLAPRIATRMSPSCPRAPASDPQVALELPTLEPLLDRREESGGIRAVDEPVVVRQREVRHRADRDAVGTRLVGDDDGPLDDRARAEDADLWLVDDRRVEQGPAAAGVGQRERPAGELVWHDLVVACAVGQVGDLSGQTGDAEVACVADDRHKQATLGVDGDAEVLGVEVGDL